jgi:class 3 adenylate cyclase
MYVDLGACRPLPARRPGTSAGQAALPGGTVTFAFTDIESSTDLVRRLGEGYGEVLAQHRHIVRRAFCAARGVEIDRQGDAFFFAFPRARDAVGAAVEVQLGHAGADWPAGVRVQVRIGLHTGEPMIGAEGYLGLDVVRAARLCRIARGGHILVSEATRVLVRSALPDGVSVIPAGERQLKGIEHPEKVYELEIDGEESHDTNPLERFGHVGLRLAARLGEHVTDSLQDAKDASLENLAARAVASFENRLHLPHRTSG